MAAQLVHAAGESSPGNLPNGTHAIVLSAKDEQELLVIEHQLLEAQIPHRAIREPDEPWKNSLMAIGIVPTADRKPIRSILSRNPLVR